MSGSVTPGLNVPTVPPVTAPPPDPSLSPPMTGLINTAPDAAQTVGGTTVNSYTPNTGTAATAQTVAATPNAFNVTPDQTVSGQIQNIIASGSPLMQQAEANARNLMNQRGLINSTMGVTAGSEVMATVGTPSALLASYNYLAQAAAGFRPPGGSTGMTLIASPEPTKNGGNYSLGGTMAAQMQAFAALLVATPCAGCIVVNPQTIPALNGTSTLQWTPPFYTGLSNGDHVSAIGSAIVARQLAEQGLMPYLQ